MKLRLTCLCVSDPDHLVIPPEPVYIPNVSGTMAALVLNVRAGEHADGLPRLYLQCSRLDPPVSTLPGTPACPICPQPTRPFLPLSTRLPL